MKIILSITAALTFALGVPNGNSQTRAQLAAKYRAVTAYEVRPGILMTANFDPAGNVCRMEIEKRHATESKTDLGSVIPRQTLKEVIDELVPDSVRGTRISPSFHGSDESDVLGNVEITVIEYEKVKIEIDSAVSSSSPGYSGPVVAVIRWKQAGCSATQ